MAHFSLAGTRAVGGYTLENFRVPVSRMVSMEVSQTVPRGDLRQLAATLNNPLKRPARRLALGFFVATLYDRIRTERRLHPYLEALADRVLVYDGAMGTNIQRYNLTPEDFGGKALEGCNDHLVLTRPDVIQAIHESFLAVGCDVVETCTFQSTPRRLEEWGLGDKVRDINVAAARLARAACDKYATPEQPRFVAGSIGPTGMLPSSSDPRSRTSPSTS